MLIVPQTHSISIQEFVSFQEKLTKSDSENAKLAIANAKMATQIQALKGKEFGYEHERRRHKSKERESKAKIMKLQKRCSDLEDNACIGRIVAREALSAQKKAEEKYLNAQREIVRTSSNNELKKYCNSLLQIVKLSKQDFKVFELSKREQVEKLMEQNVNLKQKQKELQTKIQAQSTHIKNGWRPFMNEFTKLNGNYDKLEVAHDKLEAKYNNMQQSMEDLRGELKRKTKELRDALSAKINNNVQSNNNNGHRSRRNSNNKSDGTSRKSTKRKLSEISMDVAKSTNDHLDPKKRKLK